MNKLQGKQVTYLWVCVNLLGAFWTELLWKAPSVKKVYSVNYVFLSQNQTNKLEAKQATSEWYPP